MESETADIVETVRALVRPFVAVTIILLVALLAITGKIEPGEILAISGTIIGFYFGERKAQKTPNA